MKKTAKQLAKRGLRKAQRRVEAGSLKPDRVSHYVKRYVKKKSN